jgi:hypothetical protein
MSRTLDELLAAQARAMGRTAIHTVQMRGVLCEGAMEVPDFTVSQRRPSLLRVNAGTFAEGYDGTQAWEKPSQQVRGSPVDGAAAQALWRAAHWPNLTRSLLDCRREGHHLAWIGLEALDGNDYHTIQVTLTDGFTRQYYLDALHLRLTRWRDIRPLHPDQPEETIEAQLDDFRELDGLAVPFRQIERRLSDGAVLTTLQWQTITINAALPDDYCHVP